MTSGRLFVAGGLLWCLAGALDAQSSGVGFTLDEAIWVGADIAILGGLLGLRTTGRRTASAGLQLAIVARVLFVAAEVVCLAQHSEANALLPIAAIVSAIGMTAYGAATARAHPSAGPMRIAALSTGLYPFVAMFPIVALTGQPNELAIAGWGLPIAFLGTALLRATMRA